MIASISYPTTVPIPDTRLPKAPGKSALLDNQRVFRAQNGDLEAFNELVLAYQDCVYRQALWMLNDETAAEDACQEVFLNVYRKFGTFHGGPFRPWLLKITTNFCLDQIRLKKRKHCCTFRDMTQDEDDEENAPYWVSDPACSPEEAAEQNETGAVIKRAVQKLQLLYRLPVVLVDLQEFDYAEAASILNISLGTLKSRLSRARTKLREDLSVLIPGNGFAQQLN